MHLRASDERPLYVSTRDCRSWFEHLALPVPLREYMAQQPVSCKDLIGIGLSLEELRSYFEDLPAPLSDHAVASLHVYPVACTWPQGFSWSPVVAQEKLLDLAAKAGFDSSRILAPNQPPPIAVQQGSSTVSLIYDDLIHFTRDVIAGRAELDTYDQTCLFENIRCLRTRTKVCS